MSDKNKFQSSKKLTKADGTVAWVWEGKLHNMEEAALVHLSGKKEYYINGIQYSYDDWKERRRNREGLPWYKTAMGQAGQNRN